LYNPPCRRKPTKSEVQVLTQIWCGCARAARAGCCTGWPKS